VANTHEHVSHIVTVYALD